MIIESNSEDMIVFVIEQYTPYQNQIPDTFIKGKEITYLLKENSLMLALNTGFEGMNTGERELIMTKIDDLPSMTYRFSSHYKWEVWECN